MSQQTKPPPQFRRIDSRWPRFHSGLFKDLRSKKQISNGLWDSLARLNAGCGPRCRNFLEFFGNNKQMHWLLLSFCYKNRIMERALRSDVVGREFKSWLSYWLAVCLQVSLFVFFTLSLPNCKMEKIIFNPEDEVTGVCKVPTAIIGGSSAPMDPICRWEAGILPEWLLRVGHLLAVALQAWTSRPTCQSLILPIQSIHDQLGAERGAGITQCRGEPASVLGELTALCWQQNGLSLLIQLLPGWWLAFLVPPEWELLKQELWLFGAASLGACWQQGTEHRWNLLRTQEDLATQFLVFPITDSWPHFFSWPIL